MSFTLFEKVPRKAHKAHRCIWCGQAIAVADPYLDERSVYDGNVQRHRWHPECDKAALDYFRESHEEEFQPWENERPAGRILAMKIDP